VGYLGLGPLAWDLALLVLLPFLLTFCLPLMANFFGLTMISFSNVFANKGHTTLRLSLVNVPGLNKLLRSEIFVSED